VPFITVYWSILLHYTLSTCNCGWCFLFSLSQCWYICKYNGSELELSEFQYLWVVFQRTLCTRSTQETQLKNRIKRQHQPQHEHWQEGAKRTYMPLKCNSLGRQTDILDRTIQLTVTMERNVHIWVNKPKDEYCWEWISGCRPIYDFKGSGMHPVAL
jgi:hypothetical protein